MTAKMTYNELYSDMVKCFSIKKKNNEYRLGDYMRARAAELKHENKPAEAKTKEQNLPIVREKANETPAIAAFFSYVNEKLTIKEAPIKNKTIKRFPLRASLTALFSAFIICGLMLCYGIMGISTPEMRDDIALAPAELSESVDTDYNAEMNRFNDFC